jgi:hypothetical protein
MSFPLAPHECISYSSPEPPDEILFRLRAISESGFRILRLFKSNKLFEGNVQQSAFKIRRIINYTNDLMPIIEGIVSHQGCGSLVEVRLRLSRRAAVAYYLFVGMSLSFLIGYVCSVLHGDQPLSHSLLTVMISTPLLIFLFVHSVFWLESRRAKATLKGSLELQEVMQREKEEGEEKGTQLD